MGALEAWRAFSLLTAASVAAVAILLILSGQDTMQIVSFAGIVLAVYLYIVYKRYHIELVTEGDVRLFTDPEDLKILTEIYGLGSSDRHYINRQRLLNFSRENLGNSFVWVAPPFVMRFRALFVEEKPAPEDKELTAGALMMKLLSETPSQSSLSGPLLWGASRSDERLAGLSSCPVCESPHKGDEPVCPDCGADLEFYSVLAESRVGRELIHRKAGGKRKLRYSVHAMADS